MFELPPTLASSPSRARSDEARAAARDMAKAELAKRLQQIDMTAHELNAYATYLNRVQREAQQLRLVLEASEARQKQREWLTNQQMGELDDAKLVDGATGERLIYKRRGEATPMHGAPQSLPKRLCFLVDISGSMYRFNGSDKRLDRMLETATMIMEVCARTVNGLLVFV
jgi:hypothetical protein